MNVKLRRLLMPLLRHDAAGKPPTFRTRSAARQAIYLIEKPVSMKSKAAKVRREQQRTSARQSHNLSTSEIRAAVMKRAGNRCEAWDLVAGWWQSCHAQPAGMDHWLGGSGRRIPKQRVETCWALCVNHDSLRTHNSPSAEYWNGVFAAHCRVHGYEPIAHIEHQPLPGKAAGPPKAAPSSEVSAFKELK